jgi:hypothetical protein
MCHLALLLLETTALDGSITNSSRNVQFIYNRRLNWDSYQLVTCAFLSQHVGGHPFRLHLTLVVHAAFMIIGNLQY